MFRDRIQVPLLGYFAVAAPILLACLMGAEAVMGPAGPMPLSTHSPVLAKAFTSGATARTFADASRAPGGSISIVPVRQDPAPLAQAAPETTGRATAAAAAEPVRAEAARKKPQRKKWAVKRSRDTREVAFERRQWSAPNIW